MESLRMWEKISAVRCEYECECECDGGVSE